MTHPGGRPRKIRSELLRKASELHARGYSWRQVGLALKLNPGTLPEPAPKASKDSADPPTVAGAGEDPPHAREA